MTLTELLALEQPVQGLTSDEVPPPLVARAIEYNADVAAFHEAVRGALYTVQGGRAIEPEKAEALRALAADLIAARAWLLERARLPSGSRSC